MSIIDKLGLVNQRVIKSEGGIAYSFERVYDYNFVAKTPEMLEALIKYCLSYETNTDIIESSDVWYSLFINVIERATGKSLEEIKELIE